MGTNTNLLCFIQIYKVACFAFCVYQAFLMVEDYIENKDSAAVQYKTYQNIGQMKFLNYLKYILKYFLNIIYVLLNSIILVY